VHTLKKAAKLFCLLNTDNMDHADSRVMTSSASSPSSTLLITEEEGNSEPITRQQLLLSLVQGFLDADELYQFLEMCCWCTPLKDQFVELLTHREQTCPGTNHRHHHHQQLGGDARGH
jgi:hypothetical protein